MLRRSTAALALAAIAAALVPACQCSATPQEQAPEQPEPIDPIAPLHDFEEARRHAADFAHLPASDHALGADPIAVRALPDAAAPARFVGLLRGRDAMVLLDDALKEMWDPLESTCRHASLSIL